MLEKTATALADGLRQAFDTAAIPAQVHQAHTLVGLFFTDHEVTDYDSAAAADAARYTKFFHHLLDGGISIAPSPFETWFPSLAHTTTDIEETVNKAAAALSHFSEELVQTTRADARDVRVRKRCPDVRHRRVRYAEGGALSEVRGRTAGTFG